MVVQEALILSCKYDFNILENLQVVEVKENMTGEVGMALSKMHS